MESVIDKLIEEVQLLAETPKSEGGIADILALNAIYFGDPGVIPVSNFPCATIEPDANRSFSETTGYDTRALHIAISLHIDAREFYDRDAEEATGDRALVEATEALASWFRRREKRQLDGTVRDISVEETYYQPIRRTSTLISKSSRTSFVVRKNYVRQ